MLGGRVHHFKARPGVALGPELVLRVQEHLEIDLITHELFLKIFHCMAAAKYLFVEASVLNSSVCYISVILALEFVDFVDFYLIFGQSASFVKAHYL
jgi:hypothetical protein